MKEVNRVYKCIGVLVIGLLISFGLAFAKLFVGLKVNSLCIMLDAVNSFFDVAGGFITILAFGFVLRGKDKNGLGYGRAEYLASFVLAVGVAGFGVLFLIRAIDRLMLPVPIWFGWAQFYAVLGALLGKIALSFLYYFSNKKLNSKALKAMVADSVLDIGLTAMSLISFVVSKYSAYAVDAIFGIVLSLVVIVFGIKLIFEATNLLLGTSHKKDAEELKAMLSAVPEIVKVGEVRISDYGYENVTAIAQVKLADDINLELALTALENAKKSIYELMPINVDFSILTDIEDTDNVKIWKNGKLIG